MGEIFFRTYGLKINELILVLLLALTVFPVDWFRKYILKKNVVLPLEFNCMYYYSLI